MLFPQEQEEGEDMASLYSQFVTKSLLLLLLLSLSLLLFKPGRLATPWSPHSSRLPSAAGP